MRNLRPANALRVLFPAKPVPVKSVLNRFLPIALAVTLLAYTLRSMPLANLTGQLRLASPAWISLTGLVLTVQTVLRAVRWRMLLRSLGYRPPLGRSLTAMLAGNVSGLILPGSGELIRCTILNRADGVPLPQSLGTVVAERFVDLIAIGLLLTATLLVQTGRIVEYLRRYVRLPDAVRDATGTQLVLLGLALLLAGLTSIWLLRTGWRQLPERYQFRDKVTGLRQGLASAYRVKNVSLYVFVNALIHGLSVVCLVTLLKALPITQALSWSASLTLAAVTALGSITIPTQASLGSYHFLASRALLAYGISLVNGTVWATFSHAVITVVNLALSVIGFLLALRWLGGSRSSVVALSKPNASP